MSDDDDERQREEDERARRHSARNRQQLEQVLGEYLRSRDGRALVVALAIEVLRSREGQEIRLDTLRSKEGRELIIEAMAGEDGQEVAMRPVLGLFRFLRFELVGWRDLRPLQDQFATLARIHEKSPESHFLFLGRMHDRAAEIDQALPFVVAMIEGKNKGLRSAARWIGGVLAAVAAAVASAWWSRGGGHGQ